MEVDTRHLGEPVCDQAAFTLVMRGLRVGL